MPIYSSIFISLVIFFFFSCQKKTPAESDHPIYPVHLENAKATGLQELISTVRFVPLETSFGNEIARISKIVCSSKHILVADPVVNAVYLFNLDGKLLSRICRIGNGPGEYAEITDITENNSHEKIMLLDAAQKKVITFSLDGEFIKETFLITEQAPLHFHSIDNEWVAYDYQRSTTQKNWQYNLIVSSEDQTSTLYKYLPYKIPLGISFSPRITLFELNDELIYVPQYSSTVYTITAKDIFPRYTFDFGDKWVDDEFMKKQWDTMTFMNQLKQSDYVYFFNSLESATHIYAYFMYKDTPYHCLIDKKSGGLSLLKGTETHTCYNHILSINEDEFVVPLDPSVYNEMRIDKKWPSVSTLDSISEDSNPLLMYIKFKQ